MTPAWMILQDEPQRPFVRFSKTDCEDETRLTRVATKAYLGDATEPGRSRLGVHYVILTIGPQGPSLGRTRVDFKLRTLEMAHARRS